MRKVLYFLMLLASVCTSAQSNEEQLVTFIKGQRATIILPITPDAGKGRYYRLDRCENNQIIFEEEIHPKARVPYIIVPDEDFSIDLQTLDLTEYSYDTTSIYGIDFIGSYAHLNISPSEEEDIYIIDTTLDCDDYLYIIGPLRAYLDVDWRIHFTYFEYMPIILHDNNTSISTPSVQKMKNSTNHYNLQGQRINGLQKGLNIVDGKKVFVR